MEQTLKAHCFAPALQTVQAAVEAGCCPGAAVAFGCRNEVLAEGCFGTAAPLDAPVEPVTPQTEYDLASLSKIFSTTLLFLLSFESGLLHPRQTLSDFFPTAPADKRSVTLHELLTHSSGLPAWTFLDRLPGGPKSALANILRLSLADAPGARVRYSDLGFLLLGGVLERVYGQPLGQLAGARIFAPLGMTETGSAPPPERCAPTERGADGNWLRGVVHDENARFLGGNAGHAGVFSTLRDAERLVSMLACGGCFAPGAGPALPEQGALRVKATRRFLSQAVLRAAAQDLTPGLSARRGLGFQMQGCPEDFIGSAWGPDAFGHTGFTGTSFAVEPHSGFYTVLLTNRVHPTREPNLFADVRLAVHTAAIAAFRHYEKGATD